MFVGGFYALYLGGIFESSVDSHAAHVLMNLHFLMSGYLFYWVVIGVDPSPRDVQPVTKLAMVFGSLPFHAFFGIAIMMSGSVFETVFANPPSTWHLTALSDQNTAGSIAWAFGEAPTIVVLLVLFVQWARSDQREAKRKDRKADRDGDQELADYNAFLAGLAQRSGDTSVVES